MNTTCIIQSLYKQLNFFPLNSSADFTNDNGNSLKGAFIHLLKIPNTSNLIVPFSILNNKHISKDVYG